MKKLITTIALILVSSVCYGNETVIRFENAKTVVIKEVCIRGYLFIVGSTTLYGGVSITQVFKNNTIGTLTSVPVKCKK